MCHTFAFSFFIHTSKVNNGLMMDVGTLVWVKVADYPWWPAIVVDPVHLEGTGYTMPDDKDTFVQFYHTGDTGFVSCSDEAEVVLFRGESDGDKLDPQDESCRLAITEALEQYNAAVRDATLHSSSNHKDSTDEAAVQNESRGREKRDKKDKKEKKDKKSKKEKREKKEKKKKRHRDDDTDDDSDDDEDEAAHRKSKKKSESGAAHDINRKKPRDAKTPFYEREVQSPHRSGAPEMPVDTRPAPKPLASDTKLAALRDELVHAMSVRDVKAMRGALAELARISVTVKQLKKSRIGVVVGSLLGGEFPQFKLLAHAILQFWFAYLPKDIKEKFTAEDEIEQVSNKSVDDADEPVEEMAQLHGYGVEVERCFDVEEAMVTGSNDEAVTPTPTPVGDNSAASLPSSLVSPAHIAKVIESQLVGASDELKQLILNFLKSSEHQQTRLDLLESRISAEAFVSQMTAKWTSRDSGSVSALTAVTLDASVEDEYDNVTHLLKCPECGARSAAATEMMTGSHGEDHTVVVWATCTKCHHGWTVGS